MLVKHIFTDLVIELYYEAILELTSSNYRHIEIRTVRPISYDITHLRDCFAVMVNFWSIICGIRITQFSFQSAYKLVVFLTCNSYAIGKDESCNGFISAPADSKLVALLQC